MRYALSILVLAFAAPAFADDAAKLSARIDELLAAKWAKAKVEPAPAADDAEFFRRLCLDLTGRVPSLSARPRLPRRRPAGQAPALGRRTPRQPGLHDRYARTSRTTGGPCCSHRRIPARSPRPARGLPPQAVPRERPYDKVVRDLLTSADSFDYFTAYENKPENVAGSTRVFLGVRLECPVPRGPLRRHLEPRAVLAVRGVFLEPSRPAIRGQSGHRVLRETDGPPRIKMPEKDEYITAKFRRHRSELEERRGTACSPRGMDHAPREQWFARAASTACGVTSSASGSLTR